MVAVKILDTLGQKEAYMWVDGWYFFPHVSFLHALPRFSFSNLNAFH
jgi:hypothetical protein